MDIFSFSDRHRGERIIKMNDTAVKPAQKSVLGSALPRDPNRILPFFRKTFIYLGLDYTALNPVRTERSRLSILDMFYIRFATRGTLCMFDYYIFSPAVRLFL